MKKIILGVCLLSVLHSCADSDKNDATSTTTTVDTSSTATAADTGSTSGQTYVPADSATAQRNWMAYSTPGDMHKMMASWDGTWTGTMKMWMAPNAPVDSSKVTAVNKMIYGGRYQESVHKGPVMGMEFEGKSIMGYDNVKKVFQSTWMDNMGTGIMMMEGPWDAASKSITMTGKGIDPTSSTPREITMRHVVRVIDDKNHVYEMYCNGPDGKEYKNMEITMTKK